MLLQIARMTCLWKTKVSAYVEHCFKVKVTELKSTALKLSSSTHHLMYTERRVGGAESSGIHCVKYWTLCRIVSVEEAAAVAAADSASALSSTAGTTCRTT